MALTEESIARTVAGMMELAGVIEARLETATDLYEARKLIAELETAQWAGTPDAIDAKTPPLRPPRLAVDRSLASGKPPQPKEMWVLGESFPLDLEVPATDAERAPVETRKREISPALIALDQARFMSMVRLTPPPADSPTPVSRWPTWPPSVPPLRAGAPGSVVSLAVEYQGSRSILNLRLAD